MAYRVWTLGPVSRAAHLNHYNEPFAHLFSDMARSLVDQLHKAGYYEEVP